jgi:hypothetical protein
MGGATGGAIEGVGVGGGGELGVGFGEPGGGEGVVLVGSPGGDPLVAGAGAAPVGPGEGVNRTAAMRS